MSWGLSALSGLLGGLKGLPEGVIQGEKLAQSQQQLDELARHRQAMEQQSSTDLGQLFTMLGVPPPPGVTPGMRAPRQDAHLLVQKQLAEQERQRKRAEQGQMSQALLQAGTSTQMQPGTTLEPMQPGQLPMAPAPMSRVARTVVDPQMAKLAQLVPMLSPEIAGSLIKEAVIPPRPISLGENARLVDPRTGERIGSAAPEEPFVPPPGMVPKSVKRGGVTYEMPGAPKSNLSQGVEDILQAQGINPLTATGPQIEAAREKVVQDQIRVQAAGAAAREAVPKAPEAGERKDIGQLNALITLGEGLKTAWAKDPTLKPGAGPRLAERELGFGLKLSDVIGPQQTDAQRKFMAEATDMMAAYRAIRSGLAVTNPEALRSAPLVPDDPGAITPQQLGALVDWARRNRTEIDRALVAANRRPGPAPQAPPGPVVSPAGEAKPRKKFNLSTGRLE